MSTHPFEIQPVIVREEEVTWTEWSDPDATFGVYERDEEGLAMWLADFDTAEEAERDIKFLLTRSITVPWDKRWRLLPCTNDDCDGEDWEDHAHPSAGTQVRITETSDWQRVGRDGFEHIEAGTVGWVIDTDTDNHSAVIAILGHPFMWVPLTDIVPFVERY